MKKYPISMLAFAIFSLLFFRVNAQCPPSPSPHLHVVQKGETLYRIAKKYGLTVDQVAQMNGIQKMEFIEVCQKLVVSDQYFAKQTPPTQPAGPANAFAPQGETHVIRKGETLAGIAKLYGYTEEHFRKFNGLAPGEAAWLDMVLKTNDCVCTPIAAGQPSSTPDENDAAHQPAVDTRPATPARPPTGSGSPAGNARPGSGFQEDPFGFDEAYTSYNAEPATVNTPTTPSKKEEPKSTPPAQSAKPASEFMPADEQVLNKRPASTTPGNTTAPSANADAASYMATEEIEMVKEINLVRSDPAGYVKFVEAYKEKVAAGQAFGSVAVCDELIAELKRTAKLSTLQPTECIYRAAKKHGQDQRPTGSTDHVGTDGSYPWDRVRRECPDMADGNENLVGGPASVREAVMLLLVDDGIPNRGHRRTMLNPEWKYVACYKIGQVGQMPNSWVQKYGR